ncbi:MAG: serine protease, partial [Bacteroidota bacterium]
MMRQEVAVVQARAHLHDRADERKENLAQLERLKKGKPFDWTEVESAARLAERAQRLGFYEEATALLRGVGERGGTEVGNRVYERIINANNLLGVAFLYEGARMTRAVGRITLPVPGGMRLGTGFMVSSRIMMTNNHVLEDRQVARGATLEFDFYEREGGGTDPVERFRLLPEAFFATDEGLDFTLVAVEAVNADGARVQDRGWFPLLGTSGKAIIGERVSIIQHPNGEPQQVSVHDNKVVDVDADFLHYETDTMGGSSGSPVLNINWDLVALHRATVGDSNEGVRISSVVARLRELLELESSTGAPHTEGALAAELLSGTEPPPGLAGGVRLPVNSSLVGAPSPPLPRAGGPHLNADGTATWTLPVTVTLGVGAAPLSAAAAPRRAAPAPAVVIAPTVDDPDLRESIRALNESEGRTYYNEAEDKAAKNAYYPSLRDLDGTELFTVLSALVTETHTTTLSYKKARLTHLYPWIDRREGSSRELRGI